MGVEKENLATRWRENKPATFDDIEDYLNRVEAIDPEAFFKTIDGKPRIVFSDGSVHFMSKKHLA
jgi:hypothetical protein